MSGHGYPAGPIVGVRPGSPGTGFPVGIVGVFVDDRRIAFDDDEGKATEAMTDRMKAMALVSSPLHFRQRREFDFARVEMGMVYSQLEPVD